MEEVTEMIVDDTCAMDALLGFLKVYGCHEDADYVGEPEGFQRQIATSRLA